MKKSYQLFAHFYWSWAWLLLHKQQLLILAQPLKPLPLDMSS